jgi:hypothetical protein
MRRSGRHRVVAALLGALLGGIVGAVFAVNLVIFAGVEGGYEASLSDVFEQRPIVGVLAAVALVVSPLIGVAVAVTRGRPVSRDS